MSSMAELHEFLARLNARRLRVSDLAEHGRVRDAEELFDEVTELGEQLLVADEELRTQQSALDEARWSLEIVAARNEELFEASSSASVITDLDGRIVRTNRSAAALIADSPARAVVRPFASRFALGDRSTIRSMVNQAAAIQATGARFTSEAVLLHADGTTLPVEISVRADREPRALTPTLLWELTPRPRLGSVPAPGSADAVLDGALPADRSVRDSEASLDELLDELATKRAADATPTEPLSRVAEMAAGTVLGAEHAGISLLRRGQPIETAAATSELAERCDQAQNELGEGPGLQAIGNAAGVLVVDDMRIEERWPRFAARAVDLGVYSLLACQLSTRGNTVGTLTVLASRPRAFDDDSVVIFHALAAYAAIALAHADVELHLNRAIDSRETIGQAIGALMQRYRLPAETAFEVLAAAAHRRRVKLRDLAQHVVG